MTQVFRLTWRYLAFHKLRSVILVTCLALTFLLPAYLHLLISQYETNLTERARQTPLVLGPRGNPFDLVLRTLYFTRTKDETVTISLADQQEAESHRRGTVIPMHLGYTARDFPVVGTSLEYVEHRQLQLAHGTLPLVLGDAVLGSDVAQRLGLMPGDHVLTDQTSLYNIAAEQPLKLQVVGVLSPSHTPDDGAVFVDTKTAWVIAGLGHGHDDLEKPENQGQLLKRDADGSLVGSAAVAPYREITAENLASFHFHGEPNALPLSSLILVPDDAKNRTILKGHYQLSETVQLLPPAEVVDDLLAIVFKVKRFFDASFTLVLLTTALFLVLVMVLTWKLRQRERETLTRIGCGRGTIAWLQISELLLLLAFGLVLAFLLAYLLVSLTEPQTLFS